MRCTALQAHIDSDEGALIDDGQCRQVNQPISTSWTEGTVYQLASVRMKKRQQMRWSPRNAHCVLQVRAVVRNGRFGHSAFQLAA